MDSNQWWLNPTFSRLLLPVSTPKEQPPQPKKRSLKLHAVFLQWHCISAATIRCFTGWVTPEGVLYLVLQQHMSPVLHVIEGFGAVACGIPSSHCTVREISTVGCYPGNAFAPSISHVKGHPDQSAFIDFEMYNFFHHHDDDALKRWGCVLPSLLGMAPALPFCFISFFDPSPVWIIYDTRIRPYFAKKMESANQAHQGTKVDWLTTVETMASNTTDKDTSVNISISHPGAKNMSFKPTFVNPAPLVFRSTYFECHLYDQCSESIEIWSGMFRCFIRCLRYSTISPWTKYLDQWTNIRDGHYWHGVTRVPPCKLLLTC